MRPALLPVLTWFPCPVPPGYNIQDTFLNESATDTTGHVVSSRLRSKTLTLTLQSLRQSIKHVRPVTDVRGSVVPCACSSILSLSVAFSLVIAVHKVHVMLVTSKHLTNWPAESDRCGGKDIHLTCQPADNGLYPSYVKSLSKFEHNTAWCSRLLVWGPAMGDVLTCANYATTNISYALYICTYIYIYSFIYLFWRCGPTRAFASSFTRFLQITHHDALQSVGLLWTSDQLSHRNLPDKTQHSDRHPCPQRDSNPKSQQARGRKPTP